MFGQWRLIFRQAEMAIQSDRLEEALDLIRRPEFADHCLAGKLRDRIAQRLVERAREHVQKGHSQAAWHSLRQAEQAGAPSAKVARVRDELSERGEAEVRASLDMGNPGLAVSLTDDLRNRGADSAELRRLCEGARAWTRAVRAAGLGEFGRAVDYYDAARRQLSKHPALEQAAKNAQTNRQRANELRGQLQCSLATQDWAGVLKTADAFLELAPDCRELKQMRDEAMRRLGVRVTAASNTLPPNVLDDFSSARSLGGKNGSAGRFILWVDGVGGFLVCQGKVVSLGQANPGSTVDIPILGDLSRHHATIVRDGEGYLIRSDRELSVNGRATRQTTLRNEDVIRLGRSVELRFSIPCRVSETARLDLVSRHRLHLSLAGILLMADSCVLGPTPQTHVVAPGTSGQLVIYRQGDGLCCRGQGPLEIDGHHHEGRGPLGSSSRVVLCDLSFSLEPLGSTLAQV